MKKRKLAILLASAVSAAFLAGCSSPGASVEEAPAEDTSVEELEQPEETVEPLTAEIKTKEKTSTFDIDMTVTASGGVEPYTYQWQVQWLEGLSQDNEIWSDWEDEPGATGSEYTIHISDGVLYRCVVADSAGNQVTVSPQFGPEEPEPTEETVSSSQEAWKQAYLDFMIQDTQDDVDLRQTSDETYSLLYLDGDDIPELYINYGFTYAGAKLCSWDGNQVNFEYVGAGDSLTYYEKENCFHVSGGRMGVYYDVIYQIKNGNIQEKVRGDYESLSYESEDMVYTWNGKSVSESQYQTALAAVFDESKAKDAFEEPSYGFYEMCDKLS